MGDSRGLAEVKALLTAQDTRIATLELQVKLLSSAPRTRPGEREGQQAAGLPPEQAAKLTVDEDSSRYGNVCSLTMDELETEMLDSTHSLQESVYEAMLFLGMPVVGTVGSFFIVLGFLISVSVQVWFCVVVQVSFLRPSLPEPSDVSRWRMVEGHSYSNIGSSGASLTSRVCGRDGSLSFATGQASLKEGVDDYLGDGGSVMPPGAGLCLVVLFVWFLYIYQELMNTMSFLKAVHQRPRDGTHLRKQDGELHLVSIGTKRLLFVTVVMLVRASLAIALLVQGAMWLSTTPYIKDLVLNAAALTFVLDMEGMLFSTFMPRPVKTLVRELQPIPKTWGPHWHGAGITEVLNLFASFTFVAVILWLRTFPLVGHMAEISTALCGGPTNFVVSAADMRHFGVVHAAETPPYDPQDSGRVLPSAVAVQEIVDIKEPALAKTVRYWPLLTQLQRAVDLSPSEFAYNSAHWDLNGCEDYPFGAEDAVPFVKSTIDLMTGESAAKSCGDLWPLCSGPHGIVRLVCPDTCGCGSPLSGLWRNGVQGGCPATLCQVKHAAVLAGLPCEDQTLGELQATQGWRRLWEEFVEVKSEFQPDLRSRWVQISQSFLQLGCAAHARLPPAAQSMCEASEFTADIIVFCPVTCGCVNSTMPGCPTSCLLPPPRNPHHH
mmetsp:Transcript_150612/g.419838  ORF Transcript_150612/g.419838 Transcript_150612/m.419838 type:complete len:662 (-) Transcript_150612:232-2217(-)